MSTRHSRRAHSDRTRNFKAFRLLVTSPDGAVRTVPADTKPLLRTAIDDAAGAGAARIEVQEHVQFDAYRTLRVIEPATVGEGSR